MKKLLIVLLILIVSVSVFAEEKKGLILGAGIGAGSTTLDYGIAGMSSGYEEDFDTAYFDAKIGLGFGNLILFANYKIIAFELTEDSILANGYFYFEDSGDSVFQEGDTMGYTIAGLGASYFINSLYITSTIGKAQFRAFDSEYDEADDIAKEFTGGAFYLGAGIELVKGLTIEGGLYAGNASYTLIDLNFNGVVISANLLFY